MKKKLIALLTIFTALFTLGACDVSQGQSNTQNPSHSSSNKTPETFTEFDEEDREMLEELIGFELPFIENEDYDLDDYQEYNPETGKTESIINFCMEGLDEETCEEYVSLFDEDSGYEFVDEGEDDGEFWSTYTKDGYDVKVVYSQNRKGFYTIDVYVVYDEVDGDVTSSDTASSDTESSDTSHDTASSDTESSDTSHDTASSDTESSDTSSDIPEYQYNDFTDEEKALFNEYFGFVIPFLPSNSEYALNDVSEQDCKYLYYMPPTASEEELEGYLSLYSKADGYTQSAKYIEGECTYYVFVKNNHSITIATQNSYIGYNVYIIVSEGVEIDSTIPDKGEGPYNDFMDHEKAWYKDYCGFVIPFIYNEEYTVVPTIDYDNQIRFQTVVYDSNAVEEYLALYYANYEFISSEEDEYESKTWYYFAKDDVTMSVCLSDYNDGTLIEVATSKAINYAYTDFTDEEKALYEDYCGFVIPFVANNNYSVVDNTADGEGLTFNVYVQPQAALQAYANLYIYNDDYDMGFGHEEDGVNFMYFSRGNFTLEMRWVFFTNGAELSVTVKEREEPVVHTDFTDEEKALYQDYCGFVIPFLTNMGYEVTNLIENGEGILFTLKDNVSETSANNYFYQFKNTSEYEYIDVVQYSNQDGTAIAIHKFMKNGCTVFCMAELSGYYYGLAVQVIKGDIPLPQLGDNTYPELREYLYTDFTDEEKALFTDYFGFIIPFFANNGYSLIDYSESGEPYLYFSPNMAVAEKDCNAYLLLFSEENGYILEDSGENSNDSGDTFYNYYFKKEDCLVQVVLAQSESGINVLYVHITK